MVDGNILEGEQISKFQILLQFHHKFSDDRIFTAIITFCDKSRSLLVLFQEIGYETWLWKRRIKSSLFVLKYKKK